MLARRTCWSCSRSACSWSSTAGCSAPCRPASSRTKTRAPCSCRWCCRTPHRRSARTQCSPGRADPQVRMPGVDARRERRGLRPDLGHGRLELRARDREAEAMGRSAPRPTSTRRQSSASCTTRMQSIPEAVVCRSIRRRCRVGAVSGFSFMLQARGESDDEELAQVTQQFIAEARRARDRAHLDDVQRQHAELPLQVDREKAKKLGVPVNDVFYDAADVHGRLPGQRLHRFGRNYKVTMQAEWTSAGSHATSRACSYATATAAWCRWTR